MGSGNLNSGLHVARQDLFTHTVISPTHPSILFSVLLPVGYSPHYSIVLGKNCCWSVQCTLIRYVGHRFGVELYPPKKNEACFLPCLQKEWSHLLSHWTTMEHVTTVHQWLWWIGIPRSLQAWGTDNFLLLLTSGSKVI